ncbi:MAG: nucleoside-diphosphate kinase [Opitutales bacterium]|nr:nucleoside-diphosphate kinase [Opitutales bacterium]
MERTFIILKPDCMEKKLAGTVLSRFEKAGLKIVACKMQQLTDSLLREHYSHLTDKPFFGFLCDYMKKMPVIMAILEGEDAIAKVRELLGPTKSADAPAGTIRGDYGDKSIVTFNVCHASDSPESAAAEIKRFFANNEIF